MCISKHLIERVFKYVLLRELQSDLIEGEFSIYRQSTDESAFMTSTDVLNSYRKRFTCSAASFLNSIENNGDIVHKCYGSTSEEDGVLLEKSLAKVKLTGIESAACWMLVNNWIKTSKQMLP